jgi:hypothetical protein
MGLADKLIDAGLSFLKFIGGVIAEVWRDLFREQTSILGPSRAGKTTLLKILQGKPYFIGEYNHTKAIATLEKSKIKYTLPDQQMKPVKFKIKQDVPGERFDLWQEVLREDRPRGIILILDLSGLVSGGELQVDNEDEFIDYQGVDENKEAVVMYTTPKAKFELHVESFKVIHKTCVEHGIDMIGMMVFLNKYDLWRKDAGDELELRLKYKKKIDSLVNLTTIAKDLKMKGDIRFETTSMDPSCTREWLEPALLKYSAIFK